MLQQHQQLQALKIKNTKDHTKSSDFINEENDKYQYIHTKPNRFVFDKNNKYTTKCDMEISWCIIRYILLKRCRCF